MAKIKTIEQVERMLQDQLEQIRQLKTVVSMMQRRLIVQEKQLARVSESARRSRDTVAKLERQLGGR